MERSPRLRLWFHLLVVLVILAVVWPTARDVLLFYVWDVWQPEDTTPLVLPAELVAAQRPPPVDWYVDKEDGGLYVFSGHDQMGFPEPKTLERLTAPWQEAKPVPFPDDYRRLGGAPLRNARFSAVGGRTRDHRVTVDIVSRKSKKVVAHLEPNAVAPDGRSGVWHPTADALVWGQFGHLILMRGPDWQPRMLTTAERDYHQWQQLVEQGQEESGYRGFEWPNQFLFNDDGTLLICAADRGLRIYSWQEVLDAPGNLPAPKLSIDSKLVRVDRFSTMMHTYAVEYDPARKWILFTGLDGKLRYVDLKTQVRGTLLALPRDFVIRQMKFLDGGKVLCCEIDRIMKSSWPIEGLFLLNYPKLVDQREVVR